MNNIFLICKTLVQLTIRLIVFELVDGKIKVRNKIEFHILKCKTKEGLEINVPKATYFQ